MPRLRPVIEKKEEAKKPERQIIPPDDEQISALSEDSDQPEVIVEEAPEPSREADLALKRQVEELRKSEEAQRNFAEQLRQEREAALKLAAEHAKRLSKVERETVEQEEVALDSTRAAAKAEAAQALADYKNALDAGDNAAAAEAMDRLTDAKANLQIVQQGREALKAKKKELKKERRRLEEFQAQQAQHPQPQPTGDPVDSWNLPPAEKAWLREHREYYKDPEKYLELDYAHKRAKLQGLEPGHPDYLPFINKALFQNGQGATEPENRESQQRASIMSAPVSRETQDSGGQRPSATRVTLTKEEKEFANISGISEVEYAKQKQALIKAKSEGHYRESR